MLLLFSRGVNFQYVWREFWECDGCASSQLVRSNILQALFAAPLFKAFAQIDGLSECETLTRDSQASVAALLFDSSNHCYWQNPYMMDVESLETDVGSVLRRP